ncbi:Hypothetical_protein [Hexamita inflata]|uniref:Hypothetical_protein n=1 Tax=Hexamita inflata TaxID=28002 RepID=A0AA86TZW0_9EUKA|nr:Hypothetical protein HINF_LOCUS24000 [Hexamita inflata]
MFKCEVDTINGYSGTIQDDSSFSPNGQLKVCNLINSGKDTKVPSKDGTSCVTCNFRYNSIGMKYSSSFHFSCEVNAEEGYAGQIQDETSFTNVYPFVNCWNQLKVPSADSLTCQTCQDRFQQISSSKYFVFASTGCQCDPQQGYAGDSNGCNINCIQLQQIVSSDGKICQNCQQNSHFKVGSCECNANFIAQSGQCVCPSGFKMNNLECVKNSNNNSVIATAVCVPIAGVIVFAFIIFIVMKKRKQKENTKTTNESTEIPISNVDQANLIPAQIVEQTIEQNNEIIENVDRLQVIQ